MLDHRLNSRTVYMNPVTRFLYWNMNYHVEHHMFPMVPYHALPALHEEIKDDLPAPARASPRRSRSSCPSCSASGSDTAVFVDRTADGPPPSAPSA